MRTRDILCPIDFSETANHALGYAVEMANLYRVNIQLLNVIGLPYIAPDFGIVINSPTEQLIDPEPYANDKMKEIVAEVREMLPKGLRVNSKIRTGDVVKQILAEAEAQRVGMIVIASHGYTGLSHLLNSNVAETIANQAKCPVLVVK